MEPVVVGQVPQSACTPVSKRRRDDLGEALSVFSPNSTVRGNLRCPGPSKSLETPVSPCRGVSSFFFQPDLLRSFCNITGHPNTPACPKPGTSRDTLFLALGPGGGLGS